MKNYNSKLKSFIIFSVVFFGVLFFAKSSSAASDSFPAYQNAPALTSYVSGGIFEHTYYIAPNGNDITGNGSINNPWKSFKGATSGGAGIPVDAGDLIYFRGGTYTANAKTGWMEADSELHRNGAPSNYIVVTAYPGETPTMTASHDRFSHSVRGNYIVIDGLTFGTQGNFLFYSCNTVVFQNNIFSVGSGVDGYGDQIRGTQLGITEVNGLSVINNYFQETSTSEGGSHAIKEYSASGSVSTNINIKYNRFYNNQIDYGCIAQKGSNSCWDISYNRFELVHEAIRLGQHYSQAESNHINVHHNVFDDVDIVVLQENEDLSNFGVVTFNLYSNTVLNGASTIVLDLECAVTTSPWGETYDNAFYGIGDLIYSENTNYINYPSYWGHNAQTSVAIQATAENRNSVSGWWEHDVIQVAHGITRTGSAGNRFYTIEDVSGFRNAGRYGGNIGGFIFSASSDTTPPTRSSGSPTGTLVADTTSTTLSLVTNEAATCRYSTTPGVAYSSMANTFSTTGGTSHSTAISGLTNGSTYNYYVRCNDTSGNYNTDDYQISFSIASPSICGNSVCESGETCSSCPGDCPTGSENVCCSGTIYAGNCCSSLDCIGQFCSNHVCTTTPPAISVDSTYSGYSTSVIDDGIINATGGTTTTWASAESSTQPHWIAINFSSPTQISFVNIWWAYNNYLTRFMTSQKVDIQYWSGSGYQTVANISYPGSDVVNYSATFPPVSTTSLRFYQPVSMGNPAYPVVMWLTEIDYGYQATYNKADTNQDGCVSSTELNAFMDRWKLDSSNPTIRELIEAIGLWKRGGC